MTLKEWLSIPGNTATGLAEKVGVSVSTISRSADGKTIPGRDLMPKIVAATAGAVTANDFFGIPDTSNSAEAA